MEHAIKSRNGDDLLLLVAVYAPRYAQTLRPPFQIEDVPTFVALMQIAEKHRIAVPVELKVASDRAKQSMGEGEISAVNRRAVELSSGWRFQNGPKAVQDLFAAHHADAFCR